MNVTNRKIHNVVQGTDEWLSLRTHPASELPMAAGVHKNVKRSEYLRMVATGDRQEFSRWVQENIIDRGHEYEAEARAFADDIIDDELFPVTMSAELDGLPLSASLDGRTMCGRIIWEHKSWAEELAQAVRDFNTNGTPLPTQYTLQMDEQLTVSGAEKCLFMVSDGTSDNMVWCWYTKSKDAEQVIVGTWRQFDEDAANYQHVEQAEPVAADPVKDLPAVSVKVSGSIDVIDNFTVFEIALRDFINNRLIREPESDQDFADLDAQIKALKKAEAALILAETQMLSQVESIDDRKRTKDMLYALARDNRLMAEKLFDAEKKKRRSDILQRGKDALTEHMTKLNESLGGKIKVPEITADFAGQMKGKRTMATLKDAVDTELSRAKIEANQVADKIRLNLETLRTEAKDFEFLFSDAQQLVMKDNDDLKNLVLARINEHKKVEQEKEERIKRQAEEEARRKIEEEQRQEQIRKEAEERAKQRECEQAEEDARFAAEAEQHGAQQAEQANKETQANIFRGAPKKDDLTHLLRVAATTAPPEFACLMQDAADEIERLRGKEAA